jgi:tetratricopeptide (TPR) repeat protein
VSDYPPADPFASEDLPTRALLEELQAAQAAQDHLAVLNLTEALLRAGLNSSADIVHLLRGDAFMEQEDAARAAEHYRLAIAHGADDASVAWFKLGNALAAAGQRDEAALALGRAAEMEPQHPAVWLQLGYCLLELHQFQQAAQAFGNAGLLTDQLKGRYGLAWLHYAQARLCQCPEERLAETTAGLAELRAAVDAGELGPDPAQVGGVQALLQGGFPDPDFPFWHCWINPAFELARGTDLLQPPASPGWAELVAWPRDATGRFKILRDVLLDLPEWGR